MMTGPDDSPVSKAVQLRLGNCRCSRHPRRVASRHGTRIVSELNSNRQRFEPEHPVFHPPALQTIAKLAGLAELRGLDRRLQLPRLVSMQRNSVHFVICTVSLRLVPTSISHQRSRDQDHIISYPEIVLCRSSHHEHTSHLQQLLPPICHTMKLYPRVR